MSSALGRARKRWTAGVLSLGDYLRLFEVSGNAAAVRGIERATGEVCRAALDVQKAGKRRPDMVALAALGDRWARSEHERATQRYGRPLT